MATFFKVFRAGKYPQGEITEEHVKEIAQSYDPAYHEAPLTLNHDDNTPAYAIVETVKAIGKELFVSFRDILDDAHDVCKQYRKPSIEISEYDGKKYLRAVSMTNFPAVKELDTLKLSEEKHAMVFSTEDITLNLSKGTTMFPEHILRLAEALNINISDYSVEGDVVAAAVGMIQRLQTQLADETTKVNSLNVSLARFTEAGITIERFEEMTQEAEGYKRDRIETLIRFALESKDVKPAQSENLRKLAEADYENAKKFVDALPARKANQPLKGYTPTEKEHTYEEIVKNPQLAAQYSDEDLAELKKKSKTFAS